MRLQCNDWCLHKNNGRYLETCKERLEAQSPSQGQLPKDVQATQGAVKAAEGFSFRQSFPGSWGSCYGFQPPALWCFLRNFQNTTAHTYSIAVFRSSFPAGPSPSHLGQHSCPLQARINFSTLCLRSSAFQVFIRAHLLVTTIRKYHKDQMLGND